MDNTVVELISGEESAGERLDVFLSRNTGFSRTSCGRLVEEGAVKVCGGEADKNHRMKPGDRVSVVLPELKETDATPEDIPLDVVYEDDDLIIVNKPAGMVVHPAAGTEAGTLVNALLYRCGDTLSGIGGEKRPGIVHRIDKETSGLIAVAKNDACHAALSEQLKTRTMGRVYLAVCRGVIKEDRGTIDRPIGRHPKDRKKMAVVAGGRNAVTDYTVLRRFSGWTYLKLELRTGRTHQIRVHLASAGHPLMGDKVYGGGATAFEKKHADLLPGQLLHAKELHLIHPGSGKKMSFEAPLPDNFLKILDLLERQ